MHRVIVPPQAGRPSSIRIDDPEALHHLLDVRRAKQGDPIVCTDGQGWECAGTVARITSTSVVVHIGQVRQGRDASAGLWLAPAIVKGDRFDWLVQKATELGVARLSPLLTERTVVRLTEEQGRRKGARWQRIAQEAAKQCGRSTIPTIEPPRAFREFLALLGSAAFVLIPTLEGGTRPLQDVLEAHRGAREVVVLIGPEGDFSRDEVAAAVASGAQPVSLGPLTLRTETAAVAVAAILSYERQRGML